MDYSGAMIALMLPQRIANRVAVEEGVLPEEMHITLVYFESVKDVDALKKFLATFASKYAEIEVKFTGYGKFSGVGDNGEDAHYLTVDSQALMDLQADLCRELDGAGFEYVKYPVYTPHVTLRYGKPVDDIIPGEAVTFDAITLGEGKWYTDFAMQGQKADAAPHRPTLESVRRAGSGGGSANYAARAGEVIIGNLARGAGGRFVSAENITAMQGILSDNNISLDMLQGIQGLQSGEQVSESVLNQLKAAGLANENGLTGRGLDIVNAIQTGEPDKVKNVLKGGAPGGGKPKGGGGKPKTETSNQAEMNARNVLTNVANEGFLGQDAVEAFIKFMQGYKIDTGLGDLLKAAGLIEDSGASSEMAKKLWKLAQAGKIRESLDLFAAEMAVSQEIEAEAEAESEKAGKRVKKDYVETLQHVLEMLRDVLEWAMYEDTKEAGFKSLEQADYFITWTSNAFEDREGEIFTTQALEDYVNQARDNVVLWWHQPEIEIGTILVRAVVGRFLVEIGKFNDSLTGQMFKEFFRLYPEGHPQIAPRGWGCSQGYAYKKSDRADGVYEWLDKTETTILPLHKAANQFTLAEFFGGTNGK